MKHTYGPKAFTLAETLITLVIIGIVAAMTIPVLVNSFNDKMYISALKKNYSVFSNAFKMASILDGNNIEYWQHIDGDVDILYNNYTYIKKHLNIIRECKNIPGCWSVEKTKKPNGVAANSANEIGIGGKIVTFTLNDGTNVCLDYYNQEDTEILFGVSQNPLDNPLIVWVDVNGDKKPNKMGKDVFSFVLTKRGLVPSGIDNDSGNCKTTGYDCRAKELINN